MTRYVVAGVTVFLFSLLATWAMRTIAHSWRWVERPRADRWHQRPTARLGGVAIYLALAAGLIGFSPGVPQVGVLLVLTTAIFILGLVDDVIDLRPQNKLAAQIAGGLLLYVGGFHFNTALPWGIDLLVVVVWVVAITNAMNLLDNMDGLCAGVALIAAGFRLLLFLQDGNDTGAMMSVVFAAAVAGFLVFNFSPASIFMGDAGSLAVGFYLAALNLTTSQMYAKSLVSILLFPTLVLALPIFDTAFVSVVRWMSGRSVAVGGRDHTSHRLVAVGLSERQAVLILYAISLAAGAVAFSLYRVGFSYAWFGLALCALGLVLFGIYLSSVSVYLEDRAPLIALSPATPKFVLRTELRYKRAVLWVLVDVLTLAMAYYLGFLFRFGLTEEWVRQFSLFARSAPIAVAVLLLGVLVRGLYRSDWQTFSFHEVKAIVTGITLGTVMTALVLVSGFGAPLSLWPVLAVCWGAGVLALSGTRGCIRAMADALRPGRKEGERVLVYGAGAGGDLACRELRANPALGKWPVAYLDDDTSRHGTVFNGLPVVGGLVQLQELARAWRARGIVVATEKLQREREQALLALARREELSVYRMAVRVTAIEGLSDLRATVAGRAGMPARGKAAP